MEEVVHFTKQQLIASKLVQEIAKKGDQIPDEFVHKKGFLEAIDAPNLWKEKLLIDFTLLSSSSASELTKLRSALSQWGCFQVINHGIETSFLEELIDVSNQFFSLPLEEKLRCTAADDVVQGYGSDVLYSGPTEVPTNWNDRLLLLLSPKKNLKLQCWPQKPENFRQIIDEYTKKLTEVNEVISWAIANSLNLEDNNFLNIGKQGPKIARFNLYPRCPSPEHVLGTRGHSDGATVTYVLSENIEGLEILNEDLWYKVLPIPGTLFINFGDIGEVRTNGLLKSVVHRVVTNSVKDRTSVATFFTPDNDEIIEPLSNLVSAHQPPLYKRFSYSDYMLKFHECFKQGSRPLDAFQV